jgi:hypothetical protein
MAVLAGGYGSWQHHVGEDNRRKIRALEKRVAELEAAVAALRAVAVDTMAQDLADAVMAVVARIVAARDAAVERAEQAEAERDAAIKSRDAWLWLSEEADLAVARQQLDQVRALAEDFDRLPVGPVAASARLLAILDAPARPAGHDESGQ